VTILFDVRGSTELASELDPEEWHEIMDRFFAILSNGIHRFEGTVTNTRAMGSGALRRPERAFSLQRTSVRARGRTAKHDTIERQDTLGQGRPFARRGS